MSTSPGRPGLVRTSHVCPGGQAASWQLVPDTTAHVEALAACWMQLCPAGQLRSAHVGKHVGCEWASWAQKNPAGQLAGSPSRHGRPQKPELHVNPCAQASGGRCARRPSQPSPSLRTPIARHMRTQGPPPSVRSSWQVLPCLHWESVSHWLSVQKCFSRKGYVRQPRGGSHSSLREQWRRYVTRFRRSWDESIGLTFRSPEVMRCRPGMRPRESRTQGMTRTSPTATALAMRQFTSGYTLRCTAPGLVAQRNAFRVPPWGGMEPGRSAPRHHPVTPGRWSRPS